MPVVGKHKTMKDEVKVPKNISFAVMLTHERPGLLTATLASLKKASPDLHVVVYDDGSKSEEKLQELDRLEAKGVSVNREEHRGLVRTWMKIFFDISCGIDLFYSDDEGIVLLEDDLLFAEGWDDTLLKMSSGVAEMGLKPGAMTCFRCHSEPQSKIHDLNGVRGYQSMQHGFQVNLFPAWIFNETEFLEEAATSSENGGHGIDIWLIGGMAHRLGLTSFMSEQSWVAHVGAGRSIAEKKGYTPFNGVGYEFVSGLQNQVVF